VDNKVMLLQDQIEELGAILDDLAAGASVILANDNVPALMRYAREVRRVALQEENSRPKPGDYDYEPPEPDGECFRGGEAAAFERDQQARIQRELK
jgi:hypothetical protein